MEHQGERLNIFIFPEEKAEPGDSGEEHALHYGNFIDYAGVNLRGKLTKGLDNASWLW